MIKGKDGDMKEREILWPSLRLQELFVGRAKGAPPGETEIRVVQLLGVEGAWRGRLFGGSS